ncbi:MAG: apolipoprotein N-acyltransferase [Rhodocyclaceae bacterium]|nr:apolipoprotein N-acyltransferase [Rhodocyclaceae bacterium]
MKHAPLTPIPTPTLPLKGRELISSPFKGRERCSSPFKGEAGRGMGNVFHAKFFAFCIGAFTVLGFAPFGLFPLPFLTLAWLFRTWRRAASPYQAAWQGLAWGLGFFLTGVSWIYVSLHDVGGMAAPLAAVATFLFCAYLALFPALAGFMFSRWRQNTLWRDVPLAAGCWTLTELLRGYALTGFPWLALGYSQTPPSPLAGFAPVLGGEGIGFLVALIAAFLALGLRRHFIVASTSIAVLLATGFMLRGIAWTQPVGEPLTVALLQGNIPQSLKWDPKRLSLSMDTYQSLAHAHPAQLTVLPETALPLMLSDVPHNFLRTFIRHGDVLLGVAIPASQRSYANGAVGITQDFQLQTYAKAHLVPFGEFIPPGFSWFFSLVDIPMSGFTPGPSGQRPLMLSGQKVMPNICFEDLFGEELLHALPEATLFINLSNTAWFGHSLAQPQHLQIARMRALETGRPMLRATNTGMTAAILPDGTVQAVLPPFVTDALTVSVSGYSGLTPYVRWRTALSSR